MSVEIRPEFKPPIPKLVYQAEGKALADLIRSIHSFSKKKGIRPITDFLDNRDMSDDDFGSDAWKAARNDWYPSSEGLQAVRALVEAIQADPKTTKRWNKEDPDALETLLDDLEELAKCLEAAVAKGSQFRLDLEM
jgi:hypothetical protein